MRLCRYGEKISYFPVTPTTEQEHRQVCEYVWGISSPDFLHEPFLVSRLRLSKQIP